MTKTNLQALFKPLIIILIQQIHYYSPELYFWKYSWNSYHKFNILAKNLHKELHKKTRCIMILNLYEQADDHKRTLWKLSDLQIYKPYISHKYIL